jgi:carbon monoxide dehydrogenase subunit G
MLRFEGTKDFTRAAAEVWGKLTDARFVVGCIPDVDTVKQVDADSAVCVVRPGFAFVRGTIELTLRIVERVPDRSARLLVQGKSIGSGSEVEAGFELSPKESGSQMKWTAEVKSLTGLLKAVPQGLIKAAAQKIINDGWTALEARIVGS